MRSALFITLGKKNVILKGHQMENHMVIGERNNAKYLNHLTVSPILSSTVVNKDFILAKLGNF